MCKISKNLRLKFFVAYTCIKRTNSLVLILINTILENNIKFILISWKNLINYAYIIRE